jgi:hypothetical protein
MGNISGKRLSLDKIVASRSNVYAHDSGPPPPGNKLTKRVRRIILGLSNR